MSLLTICTNIAGIIPVAAPTAIVGNSDETAVRLLAACQKAGESLARYPQGGWLTMMREYTFVTSAIANQAGSIANSGPGGVAVISGLASVAGVAANTWYGFGTGVPNNAIVTAVGVGSVTLNQAATTLGAGTFTLGKSDYPLPADFQRPIDNTLWDRSRYWQMRGPLSAQEWQLFKSSVIGKASIQRRFRFRAIAGAKVFSIDPVPTDNNAMMVFEYVSNAWCQSIGGTAQTTWQADTDTGILDEYLIELGATWRALNRFGMSYATELDEYEKEASKALSADGGAPVLDLTPSAMGYLLGPWNVQDGNFPGMVG